MTVRRVSSRRRHLPGSCFLEGPAALDDLGDFSLNKAFRCFRIFHLIANRRAVSCSDQLVEIILQRVVREAGHRSWIRRVLIATGQRQTEDLRRDFGVFVEKLVEVAHPE